MSVRKLKITLTAAFIAGIILTGCADSAPDGDASHGIRPAADSTSRKTVNCCVRPSCEVCVEKYGKCTCLEDLRAGKAICGECIDGYKQGKGKLKLISIPELKKREGT